MIFRDCCSTQLSLLLVLEAVVPISTLGVGGPKPLDSAIATTSEGILEFVSPLLLCAMQRDECSSSTAAKVSMTAVPPFVAIIPGLETSSIVPRYECFLERRSKY